MSKGAQLEGFCMDLLSEVAKKVGFKYKVQLVKDGAYGRQEESGNWNGMVGEVVRGVSSKALSKEEVNMWCFWKGSTIKKNQHDFKPNYVKKFQ